MSAKKHQGTIDEYPEEFLRCRGRKTHPWGLTPDFRIATNARGRLTEFTEILSCISCTSQKLTKYSVDRRNHITRVGKPYIDYRPGYQVRRGHPLTTDRARDLMLAKQLARELERRMSGTSTRAILRAVGS